MACEAINFYPALRSSPFIIIIHCCAPVTCEVVFGLITFNAGCYSLEYVVYLQSHIPDFPWSFSMYMLSMDCLRRSDSEYVNSIFCNTHRKWVLAPVPLTVFRPNSKFNDISQCSCSSYIGPTTSKFCTRHNSNTVVMCAKFLCDQLSMFKQEHFKF